MDMFRIENGVQKAILRLMHKGLVNRGGELVHMQVCGLFGIED